MQAIKQSAPDAGVESTCNALAFSKASFYRRFQEGKVEQKGPPKKNPRALSIEERGAILNHLNSDRFMDKAPPQVYHDLLDEGIFLCSIRTMYRILEENDLVRERRNQLTHPVYSAPELLAEKINQVWSWDITKLKGPKSWNYFHLYVIIDIFSRYVVGWMVAHRESAELAQDLISASYQKQGIDPLQLTIHADRGSSMKSKAVGELLMDLGVTKTHSRPHVSNDNPYSESQFKTMKYRPDFPVRFGSIEDARSFCQGFFRWYNHDHHHSGISYLTPWEFHSGKGKNVIDQRKKVLEDAFKKHPERFVKKPPVPIQLPEAVWINKPKKEVEFLQ